MGHTAGEQVEHAEHAVHAAHDPFDRRVTVSIAIVAAFLAAVTVAGHKAHNDAFAFQGDALKEQTLAVLREPRSPINMPITRPRNLEFLIHSFLDLSNMLVLTGSPKKSKARPKVSGKSNPRNTRSRQNFIEERRKNLGNRKPKSISTRRKGPSRATRYTPRRTDSTLASWAYSSESCSVRWRF